MIQEAEILIPLAILFILFLLLIIFRKKTYSIFRFIFNLIKDLLIGAFNGIKNNKDIVSFLKKHNKIREFINRRLDRNSVYGYKLTKIVAVFLILLYYFSTIITNYIFQKSIILSDTRITNLLYYFRDIELLNVFTLITHFANFQIIIIFSIIFILFSIFVKRTKYIIPMLSSVFLALTSNVLLKHLFHRPRPDISYYLESGFSFPSGHSTIAVAFYGFLLYFLIRNLRDRKKHAVIIVSSILLVGAIGLSRMYLGAHYASDVVGGFLLGSLSLCIGIFISEIIINKKEDHKLTFNKYTKRITYSLFLISLTILLVFTIFYKHDIKPKQDNQRSIIFNSLINASEEFGKNDITKYTETLSGKPQEPINFIIEAANDDEVLNIFEKANWKLAKRPNIKSLANVAKSALLNQEDETAPITPGFWNAQVHDFGFQKSTSEKTARKRHHARFWKTDIATSNGKYIYVGTASFDKGIKWGITHAIDPDIDTEREFLFNDLKNTGQILYYKKEQFVKPVLGQNFVGDYFFTNGEVYVIEI